MLAYTLWLAEREAWIMLSMQRRLFPSISLFRLRMQRLRRLVQPKGKPGQGSDAEQNLQGEGTHAGESRAEVQKEKGKPGQGSDAEQRPEEEDIHAGESCAQLQKNGGPGQGRNAGQYPQGEA
eukprot:1160519-Pelagomonas_calceolata.AAC.10